MRAPHPLPLKNDTVVHKLGVGMVVRLFLLGVSGSGKTSLGLRLSRDACPRQVPPSLGVEFFHARLPDGRPLRIWELPAAFVHLAAIYVRDTAHDAVLLCRGRGGDAGAEEMLAQYRLQGGQAPVIDVDTGRGPAADPSLVVDARVDSRRDILARLLPLLPPAPAPPEVPDVRTCCLPL